jgi:HSP20 family protein
MVNWPGSLLCPLRGFAREALAWAPHMDVYEKDNAIVVKAELPGLKKEDAHVEIDGEDLVIRGESKAESEVKDEHYYRSERSFGSFTGVCRCQPASSPNRSRRV